MPYRSWHVVSSIDDLADHATDDIVDRRFNAENCGSIDHESLRESWF